MPPGCFSLNFQGMPGQLFTQAPFSLPFLGSTLRSLPSAYFAKLAHSNIAVCWNLCSERGILCFHANKLQEASQYFFPPSFLSFPPFYLSKPFKQHSIYASL